MHLKGDFNGKKHAMMNDSCMRQVSYKQVTESVIILITLLAKEVPIKIITL